jgi:YVTN family beta-propeller protein
LIYAQSGAGKTSIVNANVIPTLERHKFKVLPVARVKISSDIVYQQSISSFSSENVTYAKDISNIYIFNALTSLNPNIDPKLLKSKSLSEFLIENFIKKDTNIKGCRQILVFDQLEEIFSIFPENWKEQREDFFKQVSNALREIISLQIVFIIREDLLSQLEPYRDLVPEKMRPRFRLERLKEESGLSAVKGPLNNLPQEYIKKMIGNVDEDIKRLIKDLMKIKIENSQGKTHQVEGEFIEPIQLQVVFKRWWDNKINPPDKSKEENNNGIFEVDRALEDFYDDAIIQCKKNGISEEEIRKWCEEKLITSSDTRSIVHRGLVYTEGMKNSIIDILEKKYLIRAEWRAGAKWYELVHDRLINPIKSSNQRWKKELKKKTNSLIIKLTIPSIIIAGLAIGIIVFNSIGFPLYEDINSYEDIRLEQKPYILNVNSDTGHIYLSNPDSDTVLIIDGKKNNIDRYIPVGNRPTDIEVDSIKNLLYVTHPQDGKISVINLNNNKTTTIETEGSPFFIALNPNGSKLYISNFQHNYVSIIDLDKSENSSKIIGVGTEPSDIEFNSNSSLLYVINSKDNTVSVINDNTNQRLEGDIKVGEKPAGIEINPVTNKIYVTNYGSNSVSIINGTSNTEIGQIMVGEKPTGLEISPKNNKIYVTNSGDDTVSVLDGKSDMIIATLNVGKKPTSVGINFKENILYVSNIEGIPYVRAIDLKDNLSIHVLSKIPTGIHPSGIAIGIAKDNKTKMVYVTNTDSDSVSVINGTTNMVKKIIPVGSKPTDLDINNNARKLYVTNSLSNTITIIDTGTEKVVDLLNSTGENPRGIAVDDNKNLIYVANTDSNSVSVINGTTREVIGNITVEENPRGIAIDSTQNLVYVTNAGSNSVSVINGTTREVIDGNITVEENPRGIAIDSTQNLVYVTNAGSNSVSVINGTTREVIGNLPVKKYLTIGKGPTDIILDSENKRGYIIAPSSNNMFIIDLKEIKKSGNSSNFINKSEIYILKTLGNLHNPNGIDFNSENKKIYVTSWDNNVTNIVEP